MSQRAERKPFLRIALHNAELPEKNSINSNKLQILEMPQGVGSFKNTSFVNVGTNIYPIYLYIISMSVDMCN